MKIVINRPFGGFHVSKDMAKAAGIHLENDIYFEDWIRTDPRFIEYIEQRSGGDLVVVEIPDNVHWEINEYDGAESVIWSESEIHWA